MSWGLSTVVAVAVLVAAASAGKTIYKDYFDINPEYNPALSIERHVKYANHWATEKRKCPGP